MKNLYNLSTDISGKLKSSDIEKMVKNIKPYVQSDKKEKLSDVLVEIFSELKLNDHILTADILKNEKIAKRIFSTEEFEEVNSIELTDVPMFRVDEKVLVTSTLALCNSTKFKGDIYLQSIGLSHEMYDSNVCLTPVKNRASVGPTIYDANDFTPLKSVILFWSPENLQDDIMFDEKFVFNNKGEKMNNISPEERLKQKLHKTLDEVLKNTEEYKMKGTRHILIRGYFPPEMFPPKSECNEFTQTVQTIKIKI